MLTNAPSADRDQPSPTWQTRLRRPQATSSQDACLVFIYPTGPAMGMRFALGATPRFLGRGEDCDIPINDYSVSRRHACLQSSVEGYLAVDLNSTNGTYVNEQRIVRNLLKDGDYLRVGNCIFRFLAGGNVEANYHEEIYNLAILDALTRIHNKRYFLEFLERELGRSSRHQRPLALILFDLDKFKSINDSRGHLCGDYVLRELAGCLKSGVRPHDLFARYGGEEFAVVLSEATRDEALPIAERMREQVEGHRFQFEGSPFAVTISLGVAVTSGEEPLTSEAFIQQADVNLYEAKRAGRNRVVG